MNGKQLKNSILQWAIQGKLVPQDPNDEPASVLLERIRAEKARLVKEKKIKKDKNESIIYRSEDNSYYEKFLATGEVKCIDEEIPFEIPQGWEWERWGNIALSIQYGYNAPALERGDIKMVRISDIHDNVVQWENVPFCNIEACDIDTYLLKENDILFARTGGTVGKSFLVQSVPEPAIYAGYLIRTRYSQELCPQYLKVFMESQLYWEQLKSGTIATAQPNCNGKTLGRMLLPIPPKAEQSRLVQKLTSLTPMFQRYAKAQQDLDNLNESIDDKLKKSILQEAIQGKLVPQIAEEGTAGELLEQIKQEKLHLVKKGKLKKSALVDSVIYKSDDNKYYEQVDKKCLDITEQIPFEIPENWVWVRMGQIGDWGAGSTPQRGNANYYNGKILWLKTGELNNGIVYDTEEKVTQKAFLDCSLRMNKIGDVLIAMYGATIGKLAIVGKELTTNQACCGCTPFLIYNWYLFYFLMANRDSFIKKGEGGAQPNISRVKLVEHLIPLPPLKEQYRIVAQIEKLFEQLR
ncbi:restriction endonuclease subunit S [Bacteroides uniformis]|uniref:Restriction endonuclease subunit S n=2 Tax=Bacteroidaceae TaxID=815 RepID=A0AAW6GGL6_BACUN|nr:restriction endonuclease subunit S [Bacteroides uniformis]MDC1856423.1 restriction endonuclease subunit S [Bacteroides uniformis]